jgi:tRNA(Ile2) C34 agmatinyltransferase TiaS
MLVNETDPQPNKYRVPITTWKLTCGRCGGTWHSESATPVRCPRCSSPRWDRDFVRPYNKRKASASMSPINPASGNANVDSIRD